MLLPMIFLLERLRLFVEPLFHHFAWIAGKALVRAANVLDRLLEEQARRDMLRAFPGTRRRAP
jgi:hypothetical protein